MAKTSFIFERIEAPGKIRKPYYAYLGYYRSGGSMNAKYPVWLYFGKDEIAIYYMKKDDGKVIKIFSLYVAEGTINQNMLSKKVEDYAHMPLWPALEAEDMEDDFADLCVSPELLGTGFFANYYGFAFNGKRFIKTGLPTSHPDVVAIDNNEFALRFQYSKKDEWNLNKQNDQIAAKRINFMKIILDFLFELEYGTTFEGENFFRLQPCLQNNTVLDALTRQCRYLSELRKQEDFEQRDAKPQLPKPFRDAEREWLNVCRLVEYRSVFVSHHSLFQDPEAEVKKVFFEANIGKGTRNRRAYLKDIQYASLKNETCTFFMRKYDFRSSCRILMPWTIVIMAITIFLIPFGDYLLKLILGKDCAGLFSVIVPICWALFIIFYLCRRGLNLFKLLLPRLFLGIMMGWAVFWNTEELWKLSITLDLKTICLLNLFVFIIICVYVFTDISNQVDLRTDINKRVDFKKLRLILWKSLTLIGTAVLISLAMGFYIIQFYAGPILENSEILMKERFINMELEKTEIIKENGRIVLETKSHQADNEGKKDKNKNKGDGSVSLDEFIKYKENILDRYRYFYKHNKDEKSIYDIENYEKIRFIFVDGYAIYIWSVIAFQFLIAILFGIVLQLIWEDRPITEPL